MKILDKYSTDKGRVQLIEDDGRYYCDSVAPRFGGVNCVKYPPRHPMLRLWIFIKIFRCFWMAIPGPRKNVFVIPCMLCRAAIKIAPWGGFAYWEIFRDMCQYQKVK